MNVREQPGDVDVYFGAASGQQRSALRRLDPEGVMISHATWNNEPWPEGDYSLFVDSGGYHHMQTAGGEYDSTNSDYIMYLQEYQPERYALRDYPCEPELLKELGRSVKDQQRRTTEHHRTLLDDLDDVRLNGDAVSVIQGWTTPQYLSHIDDLRESGCLTKHVAIGSVCRRNQEHSIIDAILSVREVLPSKHTLHAFGVKGSVLKYQEVVDALDSVDSAAYDYTESRHPRDREQFTHTWRDSAKAYLNWRHDLFRKMGTQRYHGNTTQTQLVEL